MWIFKRVVSWVVYHFVLLKLAILKLYERRFPDISTKFAHISADINLKISSSEKIQKSQQPSAIFSQKCTVNNSARATYGVRQNQHAPGFWSNKLQRESGRESLLADFSSSISYWISDGSLKYFKWPHL